MLTLTAQADCWVEVRADGATVVNRVLAQGESQTFEARGELVLSVGNAGGVSIKRQRPPALPLGRSGEVRKNIVITRQNLPDIVRAGGRGRHRRPKRLALHGRRPEPPTHWSSSSGAEESRATCA